MTNRYKELFDITCSILCTFQGNKGKSIVKDVNNLMNTSPALRQFMYEFYFNISASNEADD